MLTSERTPARMVPSSQRPTPLRRRDDLVTRQISYRGTNFTVVKDPLGLRYFRLQPEQAAVLELLDGRRSLEQLRDELQHRFPTASVRLVDVQMLMTDLHEKGLLISDRPGVGLGLLKSARERSQKKLKAALMNPLNVRLPGWDPDRLLQWLVRLVGWIFDWRAALPLLCGVAVAYLFLATRMDEVRKRLPEFQQFFGWPNLVYLWITLALTKLLHEFGHGLACKRFGAECHAMGVMVMVFSPTMYCDTSDSWMLRNKWQRIAIGAAGMYFEVMLSALSIFVWWNTQPGLLQFSALNIFFISTVSTVLFNLNPLLQFDGYYMLADFLEIPNLREHGQQLLQRSLAWHCLGIEIRRDPFAPTSGRGWFVLFVTASTIYRWVMTYGIVLFLYTVLKPYRLQSIGILLAAASVGAMLYQIGHSMHQVLTMPREEPIDRRKVTRTLLAAVVLVAGIFLVPFPWYIEAPLIVQPAGIHHIYTQAGGELYECAVAEGAWMAADATILRLRNPELEARVRELQMQCDVQVPEIARLRHSGERVEERLALERQRSLRALAAEAETELRKLTVRTPVAGCIIAPRRQSRPKLEPTAVRLPAWSGTPLDRQNLGAWLPAGTHVCSIAPGAEYEAILLVDQADRSEVAVGRSVRLKLEHLPDLKLTGTVSELADRHLEYAPSALSSKFGGPLTSTIDPSGRELLTSLRYQATVPLAGVDSTRLRTGVRGSARLLIAHRTLAEWLWRAIRNTFRFQL